MLGRQYLRPRYGIDQELITGIDKLPRRGIGTDYLHQVAVGMHFYPSLLSGSDRSLPTQRMQPIVFSPAATRSEERRVGKECRSQWRPNSKQKRRETTQGSSGG